jgi:hypothetical protein
MIAVAAAPRPRARSSVRSARGPPYLCPPNLRRLEPTARQEVHE